MNSNYSIRLDDNNEIRIEDFGKDRLCMTTLERMHNGQWKNMGGCVLPFQSAQSLAVVLLNNSNGSEFLVKKFRQQQF